MSKFMHSSQQSTQKSGRFCTWSQRGRRGVISKYLPSQLLNKLWNIALRFESKYFAIQRVQWKSLWRQIWTEIWIRNSFFSSKLSFVWRPFVNLNLSRNWDCEPNLIWESEITIEPTNWKLSWGPTLKFKVKVTFTTGSKNVFQRCFENKSFECGWYCRGWSSFSFVERCSKLIEWGWSCNL